MSPEIISVTVALITCFIGAQLFRKLGYPQILGQLVASLFLALPWVRDTLFPPASMEMIRVFAELGVVFLLLLTGFEINVNRFRQSSKDASLIAFSAAMIPLALGFGLGQMLGMTQTASLVLGISLSVTAEGTTVGLLLEFKKLNSKVGTLLVGAGIMDDIFEVGFLALILTMINGVGESLWGFLIRLVLFGIGSYLLYRLLPKLIQWVEREHSEVSLFDVSIISGLVFALFSEAAGLGAILGAFMAGMLIHHSLTERKDVEQDGNDLKLMTFGFIVPFFFVNIGLHFDARAIWENAPLTLLVTAVAVIGKIAGSLAIKPWTKRSWRQLLVIGWGMNSRGVMELIIANLALTAGLISADLYSAIVFMTVVTTLSFPFVLRHMIGHDPELMDR